MTLLKPIYMVGFMERRSKLKEVIIMGDLDIRELERIVNGNPAPKTNSNKETVLNLHSKKEKEREYRKIKMLNHIAADLSWLTLGVTAMCTSYNLQIHNELNAAIALGFVILSLICILVFDIKEGKL